MVEILEREHSRLAASEPSGWRLSLSRSARFDSHDLLGNVVLVFVSMLNVLIN